MNETATQEDPRIVAGARCTWWGNVSETSRTASGLPCCPHCGCVLVEVEDEPTWWRMVNAYAYRASDPEYPTLIQWVRGRCLSDLQEARTAFHAAKSQEH